MCPKAEAPTPRHGWRALGVALALLATACTLDDDTTRAPQPGPLYVLDAAGQVARLAPDGTRTPSWAQPLLPGPIRHLAVGHNQLWLLGNGQLALVDAETEAVNRTLAVPPGVARLAVGAHYVVLADTALPALHWAKVGTPEQLVYTQPLPGAPGALLAYAGRVMLALAGPPQADHDSLWVMPEAAMAPRVRHAIRRPLVQLAPNRLGNISLLVRDTAATGSPPSYLAGLDANALTLSPLRQGTWLQLGPSPYLRQTFAQAWLQDQDLLATGPQPPPADGYSGRPLAQMVDHRHARLLLQTADSLQLWHLPTATQTATWATPHPMVHAVASPLTQ